jgi:SpoIID/LytB domain protein
MDEPLLHVGILSAPAVDVTFMTPYRSDNTGRMFEGEHRVSFEGSTVVLDGPAGRMQAQHEMTLSPANERSRFLLRNVTIGLRFHWERQEDELFSGSLKLQITDDVLTAVNIVPLEEYLTSVISSEMNANSSLNLLKAHAITSRSWLLAQLARSRTRPRHQESRTIAAEDSTQRILWYDREDHKLFDVCADDHCQRYQGMTKAFHPRVEQSVRATRGEVLVSNNEICDARFSKSCGGISELFENVWEPVHHEYLVPVLDAPEHTVPVDLTEEEAATRWIRESPPAFCNTSDSAILAQILPDFDLETRDFYRWQVTYRQDELAELVRTKSGVNFGRIISLQPLERGTSGRIVRLRIVGTEQTLAIGKELEIRKTLSPSHLYSSALVIDTDGKDIPERFTLTGAGWGHGVGLCQIGAAVMGERGYSHEAIVNHYFSGATLNRLY